MNPFNVTAVIIGYIRVKCSRLTDKEFVELGLNDDEWSCIKCCYDLMPYCGISTNELYVENSGLAENISEDLRFIPDENFQEFVDNCNSVVDSTEIYNEFDESYPNIINSKYHNIDLINQIKPDPSSCFNIIHTNLASINKHFDDLAVTLSRINFDFNVIGITEHKIHRDVPCATNIDLQGYHPFYYQPTDTSHGGVGLYIKDSIAFNKREDLSFNSPGDFESCFVELISPNNKYIIVGCIYRHPSSNLSVQQFNSDFIEPLLKKVSLENKLCILTGDFNIDLLKSDTNDDANEFYNNLSSYSFVPYILQPTRPISKTLIDNIFI